MAVVLAIRMAAVARVQLGLNMGQRQQAEESLGVK